MSYNTPDGPAVTDDPRSPDCDGPDEENNPLLDRQWQILSDGDQLRGAFLPVVADDDLDTEYWELLANMMASRDTNSNPDDVDAFCAFVNKAALAQAEMDI